MEIPAIYHVPGEKLPEKITYVLNEKEKKALEIGKLLLDFLGGDHASVQIRRKTVAFNDDWLTVDFKNEVDVFQFNLTCTEIEEAILTALKEKLGRNKKP